MLQKMPKPTDDLDLLPRNASSVPECGLVGEAKLMKGPAYVAWELAQAAKLDDEQHDIVAFLVQPMKDAFSKRPNISTHHLSKCGALAAWPSLAAADVANRCC